MPSPKTVFNFLQNNAFYANFSLVLRCIRSIRRGGVPHSTPPLPFNPPLLESRIFQHSVTDCSILLHIAFSRRRNIDELGAAASVLVGGVI